MKTKHTLKNLEISESGHSIWFTSPLNARVRLLNMVNHSSMNGINLEANAAHIVKCVNLHDELVEALGKFIDHALNGREQTRLAVHDLTRFNDLLKKAKGE